MKDKKMKKNTEANAAKPIVFNVVTSVYEICANAVVVIWSKGDNTYKMLYSYATPIAVAKFYGFGSLERIYAFKTTNPTARTRTTMNHYRKFCDWLHVDKSANNIDNLEEAEVV